MQVTASSKKNEFFAISLYLQNLAGFSFTTTGLKMQFSSPFGLVPHPPPFFNYSIFSNPA
jgi:hypothetical protein